MRRGARLKPPTRRERLIAAGREAFGRLPYDEVSVSDITAEAGVAHGLPFHYFGNKHGLYREVVRSLAAEMRVVHAVPTGLPPDEAVRHLLNRHLNYFERHPHILLGPVRSSLGVDPGIRAVFDDARWDGAVYLLELFGIREPGPVTRLLINGWLSYLDEILARWLTDQIMDRDEMIEALVAALHTTLESAGKVEAADRPR